MILKKKRPDLARPIEWDRKDLQRPCSSGHFLLVSLRFNKHLLLMATGAGTFGAGTASGRAGVLDAAHTEDRKPLLDVFGIAYRADHPCISEYELLKLLPAGVTCVFKDRHKTSLTLFLSGKG
jgi:hypothetical protein